MSAGVSSTGRMRSCSGALLIFAAVAFAVETCSLVKAYVSERTVAAGCPIGCLSMPSRLAETLPVPHHVAVDARLDVVVAA